MAKNPISNKADNDRIQIRSFWISERKAPYVYSFLKKTELSHRGDQLDLIRSAISTGLVLNNLFPDLANFINGLNERLTLADLNRFLNDGNTIDTEPKPPINVLLENVLDQKFKEYLTPLQLDNSKQDSVSVKEGANKQVISSQADSLIKISRIWADFFPANTSNQPI